MSQAAKHITITGVVQGVGFRPFIYNLADRYDLNGWVLNHSGGVDIEVEGPAERVDAFVDAIEAEAPPLARIESLTARPIEVNHFETFEIRHSEAQEGRYQLISPDVATCDDCVEELFDPDDRRYRYPFINCTNCGPRFTIIADIPYDRPNTTMSVFPLCDDCLEEYEDPGDRRFHAQPNACPDCGPHIWLTDAHGQPLAASPDEADTECAFELAREKLLDGEILAIKGLGGFHLACDATNAEAVRRLRERKRRPDKPFAVMVARMDDVRDHCEVPAKAEELMTSSQCPIVILDRRPESDIVDEVAPGNHTLGVMIPYTPLHHILLRDVGRPLVMTSGNLTEEPIAKDNDEALDRLSGLADAFLFHNRDIYARYDDSVWQVVNLDDETIAQPMRRARGYAPFPVRLPFKMGRILAVGPLLKNTFTLTRDEYAFVSQHIGDMDNVDTLAHFEDALATYEHLFRLEPEMIVSDMHPDYLTTRWAEREARERGLPEPLRVQHHKAHIAACLADNGRALEDGRVIGVGLDGTGYGEDGTIWGGEWLVGDYEGFERVAHLEYLPLPGGDAAIGNPWRIAAAYVHTLLGEDRVPEGIFPPEADLIRQMVDRGVNVPLTSSMGRLFDAASALLGVCQEATYEAQAAIELEQVASEASTDAGSAEPYPFALENGDGGAVVRLAPLFDALLDGLERGDGVAEMALRFHATVAAMIVHVCERVREETGLDEVALSGGVFQNRLLLELVVPELERAGFDVLLHGQVPCNDGGLSLGQAVLAHFGKEK